MKYLVDEFANIKNQIFQSSITVDIFYFEGIDVLYCFHGNFIPTCVLLKQHQSMVGGPNPSCCPICNKLCMSGEMLMEHMKFVHKDPNASGVPGETAFITIWSYRGNWQRIHCKYHWAEHCFNAEAFISDPHDYINLSISIRKILFTNRVTNTIPACSQAPQREPPVSCVREVLRERGEPAEAPGVPPRDDQPARLLAQDVALQRLHSRLHARKW